MYVKHSARHGSIKGDGREREERDRETLKHANIKSGHTQHDYDRKQLASRQHNPSPSFSHKKCYKLDLLFTLEK